MPDQIFLPIGGVTMGSRLGVLLKTYSGWEIYYAHWAAQTVGLDIAIDGMEATYERVRLGLGWCC